MKEFAGSPGTVTGLALRIAQCVFASGSIAFMATTTTYYNLTAFCYLIASMGLQVTWSFGLALLDVYALARKKALHNSVLISLFVVGDWVTGILSLSAASTSAGITMYNFHDMGICIGGTDCTKFQFSIVLAFLSWIMIHISSLITLWLLASSG